MNPDDTFPAEKVNSGTVDAAVQAALSAELTLVLIGDSAGFELGQFSEEHVPFGPPDQQWIVLTHA